MGEFELDRFRAVLTAAARRAFTHLRARAGGERFCGFALYAAEGAEYVLPTANTEEGLVRRARAYVEHDGGDYALHWASLRWSPADWAYHDDSEATATFEEVSALLEEAAARWYALAPDAGAGEAGEAHGAAVFEACLQALAALDNEHLFGRGPERETVVVNLLKGDQSDEERVAWAQRLNSPATCTRFAAELERGFDAFNENWSARERS